AQSIGHQLRITAIGRGFRLLPGSSCLFGYFLSRIIMSDLSPGAPARHAQRRKENCCPYPFHFHLLFLFSLFAKSHLHLRSLSRTAENADRVILSVQKADPVVDVFQAVPLRLI